MAVKTAIALLTNYFNTGDGKRSVAQWRDELRALSTEERDELARGVCAITGDTLQGTTETHAV